MRIRNVEKEKLVKQEAIKMLVAEGFDGFSMNKLAKACNVSVATIYIYYKDKDDLIKQLGAEIGSKFLAKTMQDFSPKMSFEEGLKKQWENRSAFALKYPKEVACYEILRHTQYGEYIQEESFKDFKAAMHEFCHNAINSNKLVPVSVDVFWSVAYGPLYTLLRFHNEGKSIGGRPFKFSKQVMEDALRLVIKALTP